MNDRSRHHASPSAPTVLPEPEDTYCLLLRQSSFVFARCAVTVAAVDSRRCIPRRNPRSKKAPPMSVGPRVVFVRFPSGESPKLTPWVAHIERVVGDVSRPERVSLQPDRVVWQLVSANNRELARGSEVHSSFSDAHSTAAQVVAASDRLALEFVSEAGRGVYGWYVSIDGKPVMTCARWYLTDRDRRNSIEIALRSISAATLHAGARLTDAALLAGDR